MKSQTNSHPHQLGSSRSVMCRAGKSLAYYWAACARVSRERYLAELSARLQLLWVRPCLSPSFFQQVEWGALNGRPRENAFTGLSYSFFKEQVSL